MTYKRRKRNGKTSKRNLCKNKDKKLIVNSHLLKYT